MRFRVCSIRASLPAWLALAACSSASPGETATSRDHALVGPSCTTTGRVICQPNTASSIAAGPMVTIAAGTGEPPVPTGGALVDGAYQLVAETQYGTPPSDEGTPTVGDTLSAVLAVHCDLFDEIFSSKGAALAILGANTCGRLVPGTLSLRVISGLDPDAGDMWESEFAYSATSTTLTVISLQPFHDAARGVIAGSYTVVDDFALVGSDAGAPPVPRVDGAVASGQARDPRCPSKAPSPGDACNPMPAPLDCEYGGDTWGRCTTFALCALQPDGSFGFQTSTDTSCGPNPAPCPAAYGTSTEGPGAPSGDGDVPAGSTCSDNGIACSYAEGVCSCEPAFAADASVVLSWNCRARTDVTASPSALTCPAKRPLAGDGCSSEGEKCGYDSPCGPQPSLGPGMICTNGYWAYEDYDYSCPNEPAL